MRTSPDSALRDAAALRQAERRSTSVATSAREPDRDSLVNPAFILAAEALAQLGSAALVFDASRKVLVANRLIDLLPAFIRLRAQGILSFYDPVAESLFRQAAADLDRDDDAPTHPFAARCSEGELATIARILSIRPTPDAAPAPRAGILVFVPLSAPSGPPAALLQSLFDLTPAEARIARGLAAGATIDELASTARVSRNTVRSQLRGILEKTRCHRQSQAVSLLCRVGIAGSPDEQIAFG
jgi:DNA-binding CsgD family transcriptional regulator